MVVRRVRAHTRRNMRANRRLGVTRSPLRHTTDDFWDSEVTQARLTHYGLCALYNFVSTGLMLFEFDFFYLGGAFVGDFPKWHL
jgi:hypothetical protein